MSFPVARNVRDRLARRPAMAVHAVDGVDLSLTRGQALGLVGESGCGKSTLAFCLAGLIAPTRGEILLDGTRLEPRRSVAEQRRIQIVFQDPYSSLNPRLTVGQCLGELLRVHHLVPREAVRSRCEELMSLVGLPADALEVHPRKMSGGQRQRVAIARALAVEPDVLIADEPVSALDVSVQATILELLDVLRQELDLAILFISHNMAVVRHLCERVAVMYLGRIIEQASVESLFTNPRHPYTQGLIAAVPRLAGERKRRAALTGDLPSPIHLPSGCRFHPRCPLCEPVCRSIDPPVTTGPVEAGDVQVPHAVACHFAWSPSQHRRS